MFGFFASQEKKMRANASNWIEVAEKVWHYRRDRLTATEADDLRRQTDDLRRQVKTRADAAKLKLGIESLEAVLRRTGGSIYPKTTLVDNVEFFLVAAIVILGIRTYFVQPFKIPTNSMWPTYNGMTPEVFLQPADEPGAVLKVFKAKPQLGADKGGIHRLIGIVGGLSRAKFLQVRHVIPAGPVTSRFFEEYL